MQSDPGSERLALSVTFRLDEEGNVDEDPDTLVTIIITVDTVECVESGRNCVRVCRAMDMDQK